MANKKRIYNAGSTYAPCASPGRAARLAAAVGRHCQAGGTGRVDPARSSGGVLHLAFPRAAEPLHLGAHALHVDDQSLSRLRICLQVLLCALHPRVHGNARRRGLRAQDLCEAAGGVAVAPGVEEGQARRVDLHRHRNRSLSAGGKALRSDARHSGRAGATSRAGDWDCHQVGPGWARRGFAEARRRTQFPVRESDGHHAEREAGAHSGAARAASRSAD